MAPPIIINSKVKTKNSKLLSNFAFCVVVLHFAFFLLPFYCCAQEEQKVRVLILKNAPSFELYIKGNYKIESLKTKNALGAGENINAKVYMDIDGITIGDNLLRENRVVIFPESALFYLNNRPLRGALIIRKENDLSFSVINYLNLEDYVKGVLFHEVSHHWPIEAIKAQAVATRTYVLYQKEVSRDKDYDVTSDIYSQVYGGKDAERYRTNSAVEYTKGLVLTYKGKIFPAYFHATCGGKTEDAAQLWDISLIPLKGLDCNFCVKSKHFKWRKTLSRLGLINKLNKSGYSIDSLEAIEILDRDKSGRIKKLKLKSKSANHIISAKDFRQIIGGTDIRSTNFDLTFSGDNIYFEGFGWGHGVGMCQWGAYFASRKGYKYQDILKFYYPGAKIDKI